MRSTLAGIGAAMAMLGIAVAPPASADVIRAPKAVTVVVSSSMTSLDFGQVVTTAPGAYVAAWNAAGPMVWARASARGVARLRGVAPSSALTPGTSRWEIEDGTDNPVLGIPVTVLRQTWVSPPVLTQYTPVGLLVSGSSWHYDIRTGRYAGDRLSPVYVQVFGARGWSTVRTAITGISGGFTVLIPATAGVMTVRLVRPAGVAGGVTGGTGAMRSVGIS